MVEHRSPKPGVGGSSPLTPAREVTEIIMNPIKFIQEVRKEGSKVTWPTTRETLTGAVMVIIITAFAAIFFLIVDQIFSFGLDSIIGWSL